MKNLDIHRLAQKEARAATNYFHHNGMKPAAEFLHELEDVYRIIRSNPAQGSPIHRRYRFQKLRSYSYTVYYGESPDTVTVYAVAHDSRRPGYWRWRTRNP